MGNPEADFVEMEGNLKKGRVGRMGGEGEIKYLRGGMHVDQFPKMNVIIIHLKHILIKRY